MVGSVITLFVAVVKGFLHVLLVYFFCAVGQPQFMDFSVRVKHGVICVRKFRYC